MPAHSASPVTSALEQRDIRAQLAPRRYTTIAAEVGAKISRIAVTEGGSFRAGQTLITLDCSLQQAQREKAKAMLSAAEHTYNANRRLEELRSIGKVELEVSEAEVGKAKAELAEGEARVEAGRRLISATEADVMALRGEVDDKFGAVDGEDLGHGRMVREFDAMEHEGRKLAQQVQSRLF